MRLRLRSFTGDHKSTNSLVNAPWTTEHVSPGTSMYLRTEMFVIRHISGRNPQCKERRHLLRYYHKQREYALHAWLTFPHQRWENTISTPQSIAVMKANRPNYKLHT
jgi:hypothetical protein